METLRLDDVKKLAEKHDAPCVSIFMPTHPAGAETRQDPIRLKNLLAEAEQALVSRGVRSPKAKAMLAPAERLLSDSLFWSYQSGGLALFMAPDAFYVYRLPVSFREHVGIAGRFHVVPVLPLINRDREFFILTLSQNNVRLFACCRFSIRECPVEGMPTSLAAALSPDGQQKQIRFHAGQTGIKGSQTAIRHGHGAGAENTKEYILKFFQKVNSGIQSVLKNRKEPLLIIGVDYLLPLYREANTYPHLLDECISGNPDRLGDKNLHDQAWRVAEQHFQKELFKKISLYEESAGTEKTSHDVKEIVAAASCGRVDTLFVAANSPQWGVVHDATTGDIEMRREPLPGTEDLLDIASIQTLMHNGDVYALEDTDGVPDNGPVAAVFRY